MAAFGQRRKMLRQSVKSIGGEAPLGARGYRPAAPGGNAVSVEEFVPAGELFVVCAFLPSGKTSRAHARR